MKHIHEIECEDGTITQDPEIMMKECFNFGSHRFHDKENDPTNQINMIQQIESTINANTLDGRHEEDINIYDHFQARAAATNGKGADENSTVPEIFKNLPYKATTHIHDKFNTTFNHTNSTTNPHKQATTTSNQQDGKTPTTTACKNTPMLNC